MNRTTKINLVTGALLAGSRLTLSQMQQVTGMSASQVLTGIAAFRDVVAGPGQGALICDPSTKEYYFADTVQAALDYVLWRSKSLATQSHRMGNITEAMAALFPHEPAFAHMALDFQQVEQRVTLVKRMATV